MVYFVRLEYLTPAGWAVGHAGVNLIDPQRYVDALARKEKYGRAIELDDRLQPSGKVWAPPSLPDPRYLVPSDTAIPRLERRGVEECSECGSPHVRPFECLL